MSRVQIMGTYVLIITNLIYYFKVACPTTEISLSETKSDTHEKCSEQQNWQKTFAEYQKSRMEQFHMSLKS